MDYLEPKLWFKNLVFDKNYKKFHKRYNLPFQAKLWPAISQQQIELFKPWRDSWRLAF